MKNVQLIGITELSFDPRLQMRMRMDEQTIQEYMECLDDLPPMKVVVDEDGHCWPYDGWHTHEAHKRKGSTQIRCEAQNGTLRDAIILAAGANHSHGLRRTNEDKRKAVSIILDDEEWSQKSDRWIAEQCRVSHPFVASLRPTGNVTSSNGYKYDKQDDDLTGNVSSSTSETKRTGKDGKKRQTPKKKSDPNSFTMCERCSRVGHPSCMLCKNQQSIGKTPVKKQEKKKPETSREVVKDKLGHVVPDSCRDAFADPSLKDMIEEIEAIAAMMTPESWTKKAGKLCDHYGFILIDKFQERIFESLSQMQLAIEALKSGLPFAVCPKCDGVYSKDNGKCCRTCRGYGHIPKHRHEELSRE